MPVSLHNLSQRLSKVPHSFASLNILKSKTFLSSIQTILELDQTARSNPRQERLPRESGTSAPLLKGFTLESYSFRHFTKGNDICDFLFANLWDEILSQRDLLVLSDKNLSLEKGQILSFDI